MCQRLCDFDLYPYPEEEINEEEVEEEQSSGKTEINKQDQGRRVRRRFLDIDIIVIQGTQQDIESQMAF